MTFIRLTLMCAFFVVAADDSTAAVIYSQTHSGFVNGGSPTQILTFTGTPTPTGDATLSLFATGGELANGNKRLEQLTIDGVTFETPGSPSGWVLPVNFQDGGGNIPPPVTIPLAMLTSMVADGQVQVSVVRPGFLAGGNFNFTLQYSAVPEPASFGFLALGLVGVAVRRRKRR